MTDRKQGHDLRGRPYEGTLAERADKAISMIGKMCSSNRPPAMAIPAGDRLHADPCGDEDLFIVDLLRDLVAQIEMLQLAADYSNCGTKMPPPHDDDVAVDRFAAAMKQKLAISRAKGRGGWQDEKTCPPGSLQAMLLEHLGKGDPVDVGNFSMMLFCRGEKTEPAKPVPAYCCSACGLEAIGSVKPMSHESKLYRALEYVIRDLEVRADMKMDPADRGIVEIGNGAYLQAKEALKQADPKVAREALVSLVNDDPEADGTDFAHPAWWRGNDAGVEGVVDALNRAMDRGAEDGGKFGNAKLQALRDRIMEGRGRAESDP